MNQLNNGTIDSDDVRLLAPDFKATFDSLLTLMEVQEIKERAKMLKEASQASSIPSSLAAKTTLKRGASQDPIPFIKRTRTSSNGPSPLPEPTTPDRPTHPSNPDYTGASTVSTASQDEENTRTLLRNLMFSTLDILTSEIRRISWQRSGHKVELCQTCFTFPELPTNC